MKKKWKTPIRARETRKSGNRTDVRLRISHKRGSARAPKGKGLVHVDGLRGRKGTGR